MRLCSPQYRGSPGAEAANPVVPTGCRDRARRGRQDHRTRLRATAAQALARAGLDWWRIQLFLRWGPKALLGYVQEAPLAASAMLSGEVTYRLALRELQQSMVGNERDLGEKDLVRIRAVVMEILEEKLASLPPTAACAPEDLQAEVSSKVTQALSQRDNEVGTQLQLVRNSHPASLIVHVARYVERACCGWEFAKPPWHEFVPSGVYKRRRCSACRNAL